jgi:hypothetical protein
MTTNMRIIIAAIGVAVLASPVMAQPQHRHASAVSIARANGNVTRAQPHQGAVETGQFDIHDCSIRSVFTQCGFPH